MTAPAYERDPYRRELEVEVLATGRGEAGAWALLSDTILYPEGGGQPADRGWLGEVVVTDVRRQEDGLRHYLERPVDTGPAVLKLDWRRRYDHMQQHTAQHLLSAIALGRFGWATRSFHIGPLTSDIELDVEPLAADAMAALEEAVCAEVAAARPVSARRVGEDELAELEVRSRGLPTGLVGDVRLVEIAGLDLNTCGGTHLASTAEVGMVKLLGCEPLRGGCRLHWVAGRRCRSRLGRHEERSAELRRLFDAAADDLPALAGLKLEQLAAERRRVRWLEGRWARSVAAELARRSEGVVEEHFDEAGAAFLQQVARRLLESGWAGAALLTSGGDEGEFFVVVAGEGSPVDPAAAGPRVAELLAGRGGGSGRIFQGKAGSLERRDEAQAALREPSPPGSA